MRIPLDWKPPERVDYEATVEKLTQYFSKIPSVKSVMLYGSVARGKYTPGRSDLDMALVFDADVVTNKEHLMQAARAIKEITEAHRVELQLNCYDMSTLIDGRFCSIDYYFMQHLKDEGRILFGENFRPSVKARPHYNTKENTIGMRLKHNRTRLAEAPFHASYDAANFSYEFGSCLEKSCEVVLEAIEYVTGSTPDYSKSGSLKTFEEIFPDVSTAVARKIESVLSNYEEFDRTRRSPEIAIPLWIESATFTEHVVKELLETTTHPATIKN